jgi:hypothetical protein
MKSSDRSFEDILCLGDSGPDPVVIRPIGRGVARVGIRVGGDFRLIHDVSPAEQVRIIGALQRHNELMNQRAKPAADDIGSAVGLLFSWLMSAESADAFLGDVAERHRAQHGLAYWCEIVVSLRPLAWAFVKRETGLAAYEAISKVLK